MLGSIVWICPLALGTSTDFLIGDGYGPSRTCRDFFDFEVEVEVRVEAKVGGYDGACKSRIHVIVP